jgi:hypothetical protein
VTAWLWPAGLLALALAGTWQASAADRPAAPNKRAGAPEAVDAEMLRDLDLLASPDYARDREVARRMGLLERMRMLESPEAHDATGGTPQAPPAERAPAQAGR